MNSTLENIPQSGLFQAPGQPISPEKTLEVRRVLICALEDMVADHGFRLEVGADPDERILRRDDLTLPWLCDFIEAGLKRAIRHLSADLIGGANVTRLDSTVSHSHPRLPYRRALRIVSGRGWRLALGEDISEPAQASLVRFCGLLPVQVISLPGQPRTTSLAANLQGVSYFLPLAGEALRGELPLPGIEGPAVCRFRIDRLLQFILGLGECQTLKAAALGI